MPSLIFPSSSYFLALGPASAESYFEEFSRRYEARGVFCSNVSELSEIRAVIASPVAMLFFIDETNEAEMFGAIRDISVSNPAPVFLLSFGCPVPDDIKSKCLSVPLESTAGANECHSAFSNFIQSLIPKNLDKSLLQGTNSIFPTFFPGCGEFSIVDTPLAGADLQLNFSLVAGEVVGLGIARVQWSRLLEIIPSERHGGAWDALKEAVNQALGTVVFNITSSVSGINIKIGLPTAFDLLKVPEVKTIKFFPSVHVVERNQFVSISLGFIDLSGKRLFDLSDPSAVEASGEIEFL